MGRSIPPAPDNAIRMPPRPRHGLHRRRVSCLWSVVLPCVLLAGLTGCGTWPQPLADPAHAPSPCDAAFAAVDQAVAQARLQDAESSRVPGFPYLRVSRFLASFRHEVSDTDLPSWTDALLRLDRTARAVEVAQLPAEAQRQLRESIAALPACATTLRDRDLAQASRRAALRDAAAVPDDYVTGLRIAGLYWLTRLPFALGVDRYQAGVLSTFNEPVAERPVEGRIVRYTPATTETAQTAQTAGLAATTKRVQQAGQRFAPPDPADLARMLEAHAPVFEVDEALPEDRVGSLQRDAAGKAVVATDRATVYGRVAFTRFDGRVLPQVVYTAWFPARPKTGPLDLLGGDFDALVWRVTLGDDGAPLLYDSMHACGCYHQFFPTPRVALRPRPASLDEGALVPQTLPAVAAGTPVRLRIASRSHYLVGIGLEKDPGSDPPADERRYALAPEADLWSLAAADGTRRSLYGPDGLVPGSERGERWLFWPMGIREPGAMRQWGRHATAFIGRRHFDDADLLDRYFTPTAP